MASSSIKCLVSLLIIALAMTCATSARFLDEEVPVSLEDSGEDTEPASAVTPVAADATTEAAAGSTDVTADTTTTAAAGTTTDAATVAATDATTVVAAGATTDATTSATTAAAASSTAAAADATTPVAIGAAAAGATTAAATGGAVAVGPGHALTFFMHDILGGTTPSATAVTGVVNNPAVSGQVPFAKRNGANLAVNDGVPTNNANGAVINNNNVPFLTGLSGTTPNVIQNNNGNGNNNNFNGGFGFNQLPTGPALNKLMFGTMTVFDDELTEGHVLGSGVVGKAQGFYVTSAQDGLSQTMAFTAMFESGGYSDSLSLFGIHRSVVSESHLAIMGGTGKYVSAKGFAIVKTFPAINQHSGDGVETVLEISVYLS